MDPTESVVPPGPGSGRGQRARRVLRRLTGRRSLLVLLVLAGVVWLLWARCGVRGCPSVDRLVAYQPGGAAVLLDRNGEAFARLAPVERRVVALDSLPAHVPAAFLAVEDRRFFRHGGIDWIRVGGALVANLRAGRTVQGSSTITMQLARNVFADRIPASERTWRRKLLEARVARRIEARFTKAEILELYLNHIYFGNGAYGVEAASRHYFDRPASRLSVEQAALLAALPKAPAHYDPRRHAAKARSRRNLVLSLMADHGALDVPAARAARDRPLRVARASDARRASAPRAPYFVQHVREILEERFGEDLWHAPLVVHTTLDPGAQRALEEELERQVRRVEDGALGRYTGPRRAAFDPAGGAAAYLQGAAVALEAESGAVRALVGGRDWVDSRFNRAVDARRQVGSAFKPFVFATALAKGWEASDWLEDAPYRLAARGRPAWEPANFDGRFYGPVTLREAIVLSRNVPTVRLAESVGVDDVGRVARAAGLTGAMPESPVIALGVTEASPLELTASYAVFANGGASVSPRFITRVETPQGDVRWEPAEERSRRVLDGRVASGITDLLRDAVDRGTGRAVRTAGYRGPAAGKTGTTNDGADAWFVGYTPTLVATVWVGFDEPRAIAPRASGGTVAAEVWGRAMRRIDTGAAGWPTRYAESERTRERDTDDGDRDRRGRERQRRRDRDDLRDELRRIERERSSALRALARELESLVESLPLDREARRGLRRYFDELGREIEERERERIQEQREQLRDWIDDAAHALDDADLPRGMRERIERDLRREIEESRGGDDWEALVRREILRSLPGLLSSDGREARVESRRR